MDNNDKKKQTPPPLPPGKKPQLYRRNPIGYFVIAFVILMAWFGLKQMESGSNLSWNEFEQALTDNKIAVLKISETQITGKFKDTADTEGAFTVDSRPELINRVLDMVEKLREAGGDVEVVRISRQQIWIYMLLNWIVPMLFIVGMFYFLFLRNMRGGAGGMLMSFGRSKHRLHGKDRVRVTFKDVAGIEEAKEETTEIIEFLKNPRRFQRLGGRIPRGVLLVGPPGCGKTLLAKAMAGEADVPFFSISGSDFVEMFVGVGASRVRDLFKQAKDNSPCIIFLDEIDAIGRKRGASFVGGGHDEREQTLNAILVEMDGFDTNDQVIVVAATNRADILDHALTRPGRFDRQVVVPLPDIKGRTEILQVHARKVKMGPDVNLERLARGTSMFSGADLAAIINEAALGATLANKDSIEMADLEEARDKVRWGRAKRSRVVDAKEKEIVAYHEAGHALVQYLLEDADPLHKVSIIPRGPMGGATFSLPEKDRNVITRRYCLAQIKICFGGRIAEDLFCGDISSGAQSDIEHATNIARLMIRTWGMSDQLGPISYESEGDNQFYSPFAEKEYSEKTAETIDSEVRKIITETYDLAQNLIQENRDTLERIAQALLKYETLDVEDVKTLVEGKPLDKPTVGDLLAAEQKKQSEQSEAAQPAEDNDNQDESDNSTPPPSPPSEP